jgi:hypothetical protein
MVFSAIISDNPYFKIVVFLDVCVCIPYSIKIFYSETII